MSISKVMYASLRVFIAMALVLSLGAVFNSTEVKAGTVNLWLDLDASTPATAGLQNATTLTIDQDANFAVEVFIEAGAQPVNAFDISLNFDPTKLNVISIVKDITTLGQATPTNSVMDNTNGYADYSNLKDTGTGQLDATGTFRVCWMVFKGVGGTASTTISYNFVAPRPTLIAFGGDDQLAVANTSAVTVIPGIAFDITGITDPATAGVASNFMVTVTESGTTMTDYVGEVHFTSSDSLATLPPDYTFTSGTGLDNGVHTFTSGVTFLTPGPQTVTATDTATAGITSTSSPVTVDPAAGNRLVVTGTATMTAGTANQLTITAYDQYDNVATGYTGDKNLTFSGPAAAPYATNAPTVTDKTGAAVNVGTATAVTFTSGVSSAGASLVAYRAQTTTVDVTDGTISSTADAAYDLDLTVNPATASDLKVTGAAATMTAGSTNELTVTAYDGFGNVATGYTGSKSLTFSGPASVDSTYIPTVETVNILTAAAFTFTDGVTAADAATLRAYKVETTTVDVTDGVIDSTGDAAYDLDLTVTPPAASYLKVTGSATMAAGPLGANELIITAYDGFGNVATDYIGSKSLTFSGPSSVGTTYIPTVEGTPIGTAKSFTFAAGTTATGAASLIAYKVESTTVDVTDGVIGSTGDAAWDLDLAVTSAAAKTLTVADITDPITAGVASNVTVTAKDTYGNIATTYTGIIKFTSSDSLATLPSNYTFLTGDTGVKTLTSAVTMATYGEQTVTATDTVTATITGIQTAITVIPVITTSYTLPSGWNLFSTPFSLEDGYRSWKEILNVSAASLTTNASVAVYYDPAYMVSGVSQPWRQITTLNDLDLAPGDAIYVKMTASAPVSLVANTSPSVPSKSLKSGWNLAGLGYYAAGQTGMKVDAAFTSIYTVTGTANTGYAQVVSPSLNQTGWVYLRDNPSAGTVPDMLISKGYWVFMVNPGTLAGFTTTPLP